ncbi:MAG: hypothetical protein P4L83_12115 [Nevskia sp.]|nr:hypothetical protein [Nevskia sp.]
MKSVVLSILAAALLAGCAAAPSERPAAAGAPVQAAAPANAAPVFTTEDKWERAGYNNEEVVYTILITNQDSRILRCSTHMQGYYFDQGKKTSIADQQLSTVFPAQQVKAGIWMDMDQPSGATYQVKCKPV